MKHSQAVCEHTNTVPALTQTKLRQLITEKSPARHMLSLAAGCLILATAAATAPATQAQEAPDIEEVVVTGSSIRNSAFAQNSAVDTVSQADLHESGAPGMANYIRDLTYTQNTNLVNNILSSSAGGQMSLGTTFNLRGLGENSTLTLVDGVRSVAGAINAMLPDIAVNRMEVVLDGGSALYGSDAVAGVVNLIPIKDFEGVRTRSYFQRPDEGGMEETTLAVLGGRRFGNDTHWVGALEFRKRTRLAQYERPRDWMMALLHPAIPAPSTKAWKTAPKNTTHPAVYPSVTPANTTIRPPICTLAAMKSTTCSRMSLTT